MTAREALYKSETSLLLKFMMKLAVERANEFAAKLGIYNTNDIPIKCSWWRSEEFSTVEIAGAYAAFGNGGFIQNRMQ